MLHFWIAEELETEVVIVYSSLYSRVKCLLQQENILVIDRLSRPHANKHIREENRCRSHEGGEVI